MSISEKMADFSKRYGKKVIVNNQPWRYHRLGVGPALFWLTGGLRRAAFGFASMERLAARHTVIAPDYPPVLTIGEFFDGFDAILQTEGIDTFALAGQSYGGFLAQAYLAHKSKAVERIFLSSTGPADYGKVWLPAGYACNALTRYLPEKTIKGVLGSALIKAIALPEAERAEWIEAFNAVLHNDLSRADVISHFAVVEDFVRKGIITPAAYKDWSGRVIVLSAQNDKTQSKNDIPRYEKLFGRTVEVVSLGTMGHAAALFYPDEYAQLIEQTFV